MKISRQRFITLLILWVSSLFFINKLFIKKQLRNTFLVTDFGNIKLRGMRDLKDGDIFFMKEANGIFVTNDKWVAIGIPSKNKRGIWGIQAVPYIKNV